MTNFSDLRVSRVSSSRGVARRAGPLVAIAAAMLLAACSTVPDWAKPSTISDSISGKAPGEPTNETVAAQQAGAQAASEAADFPSAGSVPQVPQTGDYAAKQDLANSLVADRQHARYSGEALRGGTEPPASPLPSRRAAPLPELPEMASDATAAGTTTAGRVIPQREIPDLQTPTRRMGDDEDSRRPTKEVVEAEVAETPAVEVATLPAPTKPAPAEPVAAPAVAAAAPVAVAPSAARAPVKPAPVKVAATPAPRAATSTPARRPAVPSRAVPTFVAEADAARELQSNTPSAVASPVARTVAPTPVAARAPVATTSGELQFAASTAPPLPAEVLSQVPAVVSARFEETRGGTSTPTAPAAISAPAAAQPVSGADGVVIDYSAIGAGSPVPDAGSLEQGSTSALPMADYETFNLSGAEGGPFTPVALYFAHGSASLNGDDKAEIAEIAALQKKRGGGTVRVVGHASSRTSNLPVEAHLLANFDMSMNRANIVAAELMRHGVAANDVVIEAVGDRAPVFYESMPAGEAGNRRAEIFLE